MSCTRQDQVKYIFRPSIEARCAVPRDLPPEIVARCTELIQPTPSKRHHHCSQSEKAYDNDHFLKWCLARGIKWCLASGLPTDPISGLPTDSITLADAIGAFVKTTLFWLNIVRLAWIACAISCHALGRPTKLESQPHGSGFATSVRRCTICPKPFGPIRVLTEKPFRRASSIIAASAAAGPMTRAR
jgi:hypothetical protein